MGRVLSEITAVCGAKTRAGTMCRQPAGFGTSHLGFGLCKYHFGGTPAAAVNAVKQQISSQMAQLGEPIDIDPHTALLQEVKRTAGHVEWLGQKVRALGDNELIETGPAGKVPQIWIRWYQDERDRLARVAAMAVKAGVQERHVKVAEEQGRMLAVAIRLILQGLGLTAEQERRAPELVRSVLQTLPIDANSSVSAEPAV